MNLDAPNATTDEVNEESVTPTTTPEKPKTAPARKKSSKKPAAKKAAPKPEGKKVRKQITAPARLAKIEEQFRSGNMPKNISVRRSGGKFEAFEYVSE